MNEMEFAQRLVSGEASTKGAVDVVAGRLGGENVRRRRTTFPNVNELFAESTRV